MSAECCGTTTALCIDSLKSRNSLVQVAPPSKWRAAVVASMSFPQSLLPSLPPAEEEKEKNLKKRAKKDLQKKENIANKFRRTNARLNCNS